MNEGVCRRDFLKVIGIGCLTAIASRLPSPGIAHAQQQASPEQPLRLEMMNANKRPELRFDIRQVRREMNDPEGTGPYVPVIIRARKNLNIKEWTYYELIIDAGLLEKHKPSEQEIQELEILLNKRIPRDKPITILRETVAFAMQMNPEIYMTPGQMREHVEFYRNQGNNDTLLGIRQSWRNQLRIKEVNTAAVMATGEHLIKSHGFESISIRALKPGTTNEFITTQVPRALNEAREKCKQAIVALEWAKAGLNPQNSNPGPHPN